jgi:hypothetical protein
VLLLDGVDPHGRYRPFCDRCGSKLTSSALPLGQARRVAEAHARNTGHDVRIEPWESFALIELVRASECGGPFAGASAAPEPSAELAQLRARENYRPGCRCRHCDAARASGDR